MNLDAIEGRWPEGRLANSDARADVVALVALVRELEAECERMKTFAAQNFSAMIRQEAEQMREYGLSYDGVRKVLHEYNDGEISFGKLMDLIRAAARAMAEPVATYSEGETLLRAQAAEARQLAKQMMDERDELKAWQVQTAEPIGFLLRIFGGDGYDVAEPEVIVRAWRSMEAEIKALKAQRDEARDKRAESAVELAKLRVRIAEREAKWSP